MKKPFGMVNETKMSTSQSRTLGPHHLSCEDQQGPGRGVGQRCAPVLNCSSFDFCRLDIDEEQTEDDMEESQGETNAVDL
jgi:hypothetical protein